MARFNKWGMGGGYVGADIASALGTKEAMAGAFGALDTSRLAKDALDSMQIGKAFTPLDTQGIAATLKSSGVMADSLKALDTQGLMKDALDSMKIGKAFNPVRMKSLAEMLGTEMAGLGALGGRRDFERIFESESEDDLEASFVRALIGGWFLQLPWGVRVGLALAALDLLLVSGDWLEAAGAVDPPEPALRVISTAVALVGFVLALASARNSSS